MQRGTKNAGQVLMPICCKPCGANNNSGNLLCLRCGALLESTEPLTARPRLPEQHKHPDIGRSPVVRPIAELANSGSYLLQSEVSASHLGRYLVLALFSFTVALAGWQRRELHTVALRFWRSPGTSESRVTNSIPASASASSGEELTSQSTHLEPTELALNHADETHSRDRSREGSAAAASMAQVQPASASTHSDDTLETKGEKYLYGNGVPASCERAHQFLLAAAEQTSAKAQSAVGTMYATGHCAIRDLPLAYRWFARAQHQSPRNRIIEEDMRVLWGQMSPEERRLAKR